MKAKPGLENAYAAALSDPDAVEGPDQMHPVERAAYWANEMESLLAEGHSMHECAELVHDHCEEQLIRGPHWAATRYALEYYWEHGDEFATALTEVLNG